MTRTPNEHDGVPLDGVPLDTATIYLIKQRAKHWALTGIFMSMFVAMVSTTVVGTSMPVIIGELGGTQTSLTWVVTASMLASAVSAPIWGKFADLTNKKVLLQLSLIIFTLGSALSGFAHAPEWLIGWRILQGLGGGGLMALGQIIMADIISPRERGKYMGISSAVMAVATIGGPLLGGLLTDTVGWRWNFFVGVPIALVTLIIMQFTLQLPVNRRKVRIDYLGAMFIALGFGSLLLWITLGGNQFAWSSLTSGALISFSALSLITLVIIEMKSPEPMIPLSLFKNRTFTLASIASLSVGIAMFAIGVFIGQFMQLALGHTPFEAGLLTIPMIVGSLSSSTIAGQYITSTGKWKRVVVTGAILILAGELLMTLMRFDTPYWFMAVAMFLLGVGTGMTMQNLVLVVQNTVNPRDMGAASANVTFFRTIGGTSGIALMGAIISSEIVKQLTAGFASLGETGAQVGSDLANDTIPVLSELPEPIRLVFEESYGYAIAHAFNIAIPFAVIAIVASIMLPNIALGTKTNTERLTEATAKAGGGQEK